LVAVSEQHDDNNLIKKPGGLRSGLRSGLEST
jgi:hypothetical protein